MEAISLRVSGKMSFPHHLKINAETTTTSYYTERIWSNKQKQMIDNVVHIRAIKDGTMAVLFHPENPILPGSIVNPYWAHYEVISVGEVRPAKGDWSFLDFTPNFTILTIKHLYNLWA